jgi:cardiolipin synthase
MIPTRWRFFWRSEEAWQAMLEACQKAERSIWLEQFILYPDEVGRQFLEVCAQKAKAGLEVKILADGAGSVSLFRSNWSELLRSAGAAIAPFNSLWPWSVFNQRLWFFRDHQKLLVVDGERGFTGGICLGQEMVNWRDTHVEVRGPVVGEMGAAFTAMWQRAHRRRPFSRPATEAIATRADGFAYLPNYPLPGRRLFYRELRRQIDGAKHSVYLTTPYLAPDQRLRRTLARAAARGVAVCLLVPEHSDHPLVDLAGRTYFDGLLASGVSISLYGPEMIHAKTVVVDETWAAVGSFNLDHMSTFYNFEAELVSSQPDFVAELRQQFLTDWQLARPLELAVWRCRPWRQQLGELLLYPWRAFC